MECFRIDESGYTGFDLLNPEQHFQGATAVAISDEDAARLIKEHFPKLQASELKYRSLSRRSGNHPRLLGLQRDVLTNYKSVQQAFPAVADVPGLRGRALLLRAGTELLSCP
ncbi:MAG: hypothetical protein LWW92_07120 [Rhodocyclales bacterium]|nr:hypothetical protein [Rhodocyclales bacterium]